MASYAQDRSTVVEPGLSGPDWTDAGGPARSGVSWSAILAGATAAAALSLIMLLLGAGAGLGIASPWSGEGAEARTIGIAGIFWITFTQVAASGLGGYLAGRLRTKWSGLHTDEARFRDTAHGFLAWGVATLVTSALLMSAVGSTLSAGARAGAGMASGLASSASAMAGVASSRGGDDDNGGGPFAYWVDSLLRKDAGASSTAGSSPTGSPPAAGTSGAAGSTTNGGAVTGGSGTSAAGGSSSTTGTIGNAGGTGTTGATGTAGSEPASTMPTPMPAPGATAPASTSAMSTPSASTANGAAPTAEIGRILTNALRTGSLSPEDSRYVAQIVAQRTGLSQQDAEKRVADTYARAKASVDEAKQKAKEAADAARKTASYGSLWIFISLVIGALVAAYCASLGGRARDFEPLSR